MMQQYASHRQVAHVSPDSSSARMLVILTSSVQDGQVGHLTGDCTLETLLPCRISVLKVAS